MKKTLFFLITILFFIPNIRSQDYTQVYLIGGAAPNGWDNGKASAMTLESSDEESAIFTWSGLLKASDFKFINKLNTWQPSFNAATSNEVIVLGQTHSLVYNESGNDHKFILPKDGFYDVKIDLKKLTMVVTEVESNLPEELWVIGSAIPNNKVKLSGAYNAGSFLYLGELLYGDFKIATTETVTENTQFIVPVEEDVDITGQTKLQITDDATIAGWNVMVSDPIYKVKIDLISKEVNAGIFKSREELYIVGGATEAGWNAAEALPFVRDEINPDLFVFDGELSIRSQFVESNLFKILGQLDWNPYSLHPYTQEEAILDSHYVQVSVGDNKWAIDESKQGRYIIKVNTFHETIEAQYIGNGTSIEQDFGYKEYFDLKNINGSIIISMKGNNKADSIQLIDMTGRVAKFITETGQEFHLSNIGKGIYILKIDCNGKSLTQRVVFK